jgi:hypothetical protein
MAVDGQECFTSQAVTETELAEQIQPSPLGLCKQYRVVRTAPVLLHCSK